jgi:hypothetical protein
LAFDISTNHCPYHTADGSHNWKLMRWGNIIILAPSTTVLVHDVCGKCVPCETEIHGSGNRKSEPRARNLKVIKKNDGHQWLTLLCEVAAGGTLVAATATGVRLCPRATENETPEARARFCASELSISRPFYFYFDRCLCLHCFRRALRPSTKSG